MKNANCFIKLLGLCLLLCAFTMPIMAQTITLTGVVNDASGEPVIGATVLESGTTNGTVTDIDGNYSLKVSANSSVQYSYIGYVTQTIQVKGQNKIDVILAEDTQKLEEVVVVGYGTQRKEAVTGSVASMKGDVIRDVPSSDVTRALQGRVAGVEMTQTSSKPGSSMQIRIRGTRSLNASNDPLIVLDGIPFAGSINDIDPNDIKSMDILKDASSTAIYGSRGANGVIIITSQKGTLGQKAQVRYSGYQGFRTVFAKYPMMNGSQLSELRKYANKYTNGPDESDDTNTDWQDLLYRTGMVTSHDLNVAGGTEKSSYSFGVGYVKDKAVLPCQDYTRLSIRASIDQQLGKYFKIGFTSKNNYSITNGNTYSSNSSSGVGAALSSSPLANPYNEDGTMKRSLETAADQIWVFTKDNVENLGDSYIDQTKAYGTYNSLYGEVSIPYVEGLKYRLNLGLNYRQSNYGHYQGAGVFSYSEETVSNAEINNNNKTNWAIENVVTYDKNFGKHRLNVVGLYSAEQTTYSQSVSSATGINNDQFQFYNLGAGTSVTIDPNRQKYWQSGLKSLMGRVMYSYNDKYMISAAIRSDGSSVLATGHKWHTYPAVSIGWNAREEAFMRDISWLNKLKLRIGYGQTSNQAISPYQTLGALASRAYNFGSSNYTTGYYISQLANSNLGWEYSETWNYGIDFGLFNNRLTGTVEYYQQNTNDVLLGVNLPITAGVGSYTANIGKTQNKGFEFSLNGVIIDNKNGWTWEAGLNLYSNKNKLVALASGKDGDDDEANWWFLGHSINCVYDYKKIGLWQEGDKYLDILEPGGNVGMIKVEYTGDYNEDGTPKRAIGPEDRQVTDLDPDFQGGFNTRVAYKNWDLNIVGAFQYGGTLISTLYSDKGYLNMLNGRRGNVDVDYWTENNTDANYPKPGGIISGDNPKYGSTLGYFDASYLKIRTITLGYDFDQKIIKKAGISKLRLYFTVENPLVLFSPYNNESGMDPETNSYANEASNIAVAYGSNYSRLLVVGTNTPSTRNYLFGLNVTF